MPSEKTANFRKFIKLGLTPTCPNPLEEIETSKIVKKVKKNYYRVFKKEGGKVEGYYTTKKCNLGAV